MCHPGRSAAESRDPGATAVRRPLGPGSATPSGMTQVTYPYPRSAWATTGARRSAMTRAPSAFG
ncbi:hypothetical protein CA606_19385 [Caulobacter vibrioides]|uniref:Uncharacterized protein n=1 Tax=Caulobacter vibrioides TaxID=155892 RepID=A0A290N3I4_CAUVI|nr:hypothetical protein CA606_19385 [Caulobacter vibrioides]